MKLVSAIMPTRGRQQWAALALDCFLAQTYPEKELIILDDADDPSFHVPPTVAAVRYLRHESRANIPVKRNVCCDIASGQLICHWDSDDWSAAGRMADQVTRLEESKRSVTGYHSMLFYSENPLKVSVFCGDAGRHAMGTSLMFTRDWWAASRFLPGKNIGEDSAFVKVAVKRDQLVTADAGGLMVARVHSGNTSHKELDKNPFVAAALDQLPEGFPR